MNENEVKTLTEIASKVKEMRATLDEKEKQMCNARERFNNRYFCAMIDSCEKVLNDLFWLEMDMKRYRDNKNYKLNLKTGATYD